MTFPKPAADDLDALLPAVLADLARERGVDAAWVPPLRRMVDAILHERDLRATRN